MQRPRGSVGALAVRSRRDARGIRRAGVAVPWTPLSENLFDVGYWRADTGVTITGSGASQWNDQSGNARHWLQSDNTYRPALDAAAINGQAALTFDAGVVDHMTHAGIAIPANLTVWAVVKLTNTYAPNAALVYGAGGSPKVYAQVAGVPSFYWVASHNPGATTLADGVWRSVRWMRDDTSLYIAYSSGADQSASSAGLASSGDFNLIGTGGGASFDGQIAELGIRSSVLTVPQIANLNAYRVARYGL